MNSVFPFISLLAETTGSSSLAGPLIGAVVSFFIFVVTQWILFNKSRSDLLRAKLEELWKSLIDVMRESRPLTTTSANFDQEVVRNLNDRATSLVDSLLSPTPFVALYFPDLKDRFSRVNRACAELAALMRRPPPPAPNRGGPQNQSLEDVYLNSLRIAGYLQEISDASGRAKREIGDLLVYLRENQSTLIRTPREVIAATWDDIAGQ